MNEQLETVFELPTGAKVGILVGTAVLVATAYYFLFYTGVAEQISTLTTQLEGAKGLRSTVSQKEGIARHLNEYRNEVKVLDQELAKALTELPDQREIPQLLSRVSDRARDAGLEIRLFKPQSEQKKDFYSEVPVQLELTGTYHQVATFFDDVGKMERIVNLDQFAMIEPNVTDTKVLLKTSVVATSFRFLDEAERPKEEAEGGKGRRRGGSAAAKKNKKKGSAD